MSGSKPRALYRCHDLDSTAFLCGWAEYFSKKRGGNARHVAANLRRAVRTGKTYLGFTFVKVSE